jgi:transcriptional regulator with XRE-family HTH domain
MENGSTQLREWQWRRRFKGIQAAAYLGIHYTYYSNLVTGKRRPGREKAVTIEQLTGVPVEAWTPTVVGKRQNGKKTSASKPKVTKGIAAHV